MVLRVGSGVRIAAASRRSTKSAKAGNARRIPPHGMPEVRPSSAWTKCKISRIARTIKNVPHRTTYEIKCPASYYLGTYNMIPGTRVR